MGKIRNLLVVGGVAAAAVSLTATMASGAVADPPSGVTPAHIDIVGTGSDTTQLVIDQASSDYNSAHSSATRKWYSWDAVGSSTIQETVGCDPNRIRPNGSSAGIAELEANLRPTGDTRDYCVDYARSSRSRQPTDPASILFIPFAIDAVTWSADTLTGSTHAKVNLTTAQLNAIYSCDANLLNSSFPNAPVTWKELGATSSNAVVPVIPQSSSGTRAFFLKEIGSPTLGSCVQGQDNSVEENEGSNAIFQNATTAPNIIFPYSVAVYLAQSQGGHGAGTQGNQVLRFINGKSPTVTNTTTGLKQINTNFPYLRDVYNVVRNVSTTGGQTVPTYLQGIFGNGTASTGWLCRNTTARADVRSFGFLPLSSTQCGIAQ